MTKRTPAKASSTDGHAPEPESLAQLRQDCSHMSARWGSSLDQRRAQRRPAPAGPTGVRVPARSARLLDGMSDYGD
ncbi:hypothetical protein H3146_09995 [Streptomyces sp. OF3]|uniref:Uncharacterized protein n=1 Tax=Streptomyces alkaliterrae TaxID=2213162 RepID=A0A7W3WJV2_9ACTN|nr:hypothetical protein [Streptomyces alkaliterrae]MBB1253696.1 hypothetical protein [Streptomyces alkaliterrae]